MARDAVSGNLKKVLVQQSSITMPGSTGAAFGAFQVQRFGSIGGLVSIIGSATFRIQFGADSGTWLVSSSFACNSGGSTFSVNNYAKVVNLGFTQASSQATAALLVVGVP